MNSTIKKFGALWVLNASLVVILLPLNVVAAAIQLVAVGICSTMLFLEVTDRLV